MKVFANKKTSSLFVEMLDAVENPKQRLALTEKVMDLYWQKVISEDGDFPDYHVSEKDLLDIGREVGVRK